MIVFKNRHGNYLNMDAAQRFHWANGDLVLVMSDTETYRVEISREDFHNQLDGRFATIVGIDAHWYRQ